MVFRGAICGATSWPVSVTEDAELRTLCENAVQSNFRFLAASNCYLSMREGNFLCMCLFYCAAADVAIDVLRMQLMLLIESTILQIHSTLIIHWLKLIKITRPAYTTKHKMIQCVYDLNGNYIKNRHYNI